MTSVAEKAVEAEKATTPDKRKALGRGLESLLPGGPRVVAGTAAAPIAASSNSIVVPEIQAQATRTAPGDAVLQIRLDDIDQNPYQTRDRFDAEMMQELAESIRANGVVQPIVVRPGKDGRYVLILGERRCRASKLAGKETISAIVRKVSDQQAAEMTV